MRDNDFTKILGWPGYRVYRDEIVEHGKALRLWVRGKRGNRKLICSGCGRKFSEAHDYNEREVRDLPWGEYRTMGVIEVYWVCRPNCGVKVEKVPPWPSKAPFSKRFEEAVGQACESASVRQVARQFRLAASTVRAMDLRYLKRWDAARRKAPLKRKPRRRNLWVSDTFEWRSEARLAQPANPVPDSAASALCIRSPLPFEPVCPTR